MKTDVTSSLLTEQELNEAMLDIREMIVGNKTPDTDVLELTERVDSKNIQNSKTKNLYSILNNALKNKEKATKNPESSKESLKYLLEAVKKGDNEKQEQLESLMIKALRPELRDWMNANLPAIVQKIVEKEIKKLVP